jgi:thiamine pyrophosphokinase
MKALLFASGQVGKTEIGKIKNNHFDIIIAANGGALNALKWSYQPDIVIGDLDSLDQDAKSELSKAKFILRTSQELNDLEKALIFCKKADVTDLTLLGLTGKRVDHTFNNFSVLSRYDQSFELTIYDSHAQIYLVRSSYEFRGKTGQTVSLIPLGNVNGVTTRGLKFPLRNEPLYFGQREGASNNIVSNPVQINVDSGLLLLFIIDQTS